MLKRSGIFCLPLKPCSPSPVCCCHHSRKEAWRKQACHMTSNCSLTMADGTMADATWPVIVPWHWTRICSSSCGKADSICRIVLQAGRCFLPCRLLGSKFSTVGTGLCNCFGCKCWVCFGLDGTNCSINLEGTRGKAVRRGEPLTYLDWTIKKKSMFNEGSQMYDSIDACCDDRGILPKSWGRAWKDQETRTVGFHRHLNSC